MRRYPKLLTTQQVAALCGLSPITVARRHLRGLRPHPVTRVSGQLRYAADEVESWMRSEGRPFVPTLEQLEEAAALESAQTAELLTAREVAALARVKPSTIRQRVKRSLPPHPVRVGRLLRFHRTDVVRWLGGEGQVDR